MTEIEVRTSPRKVAAVRPVVEARTAGAVEETGLPPTPIANTATPIKAPSIDAIRAAKRNLRENTNRIGKQEFVI
jgi:hypothetical protein